MEVTPAELVARPLSPGRTHRSSWELKPTRLLKGRTPLVTQRTRASQVLKSYAPYLTGVLVLIVVATGLAMVLIGLRPVWTRALFQAHPLDGENASGAPGRMSDGCQHVYLDVGTNIGVQLRKLYEPQHYPGAKVLPLFDEYFSPNRMGDRKLCAFGWEPNPAHTRRLLELQDAYKGQGCRLHIFTETAVGTAPGTIPFFWTGNQWHDLAASAIPGEFLEDGKKRGFDIKKTETSVMDLGEFLLKDIFSRDLPDKSSVGIVVMKLDVEGTEIDLLPHLLERGALCQVDVLFVEFHPNLFRPREESERYATMTRFLDNSFRRGSRHPCKLRLMQLDDETYAFDNGFSNLKEHRWMRLNATFAATVKRPPLPGR